MAFTTTVELGGITFALELNYASTVDMLSNYVSAKTPEHTITLTHNDIDIECARQGVDPENNRPY